MDGEFITTQVKLERKQRIKDDNPKIREDFLTLTIDLIGFGDTSKITDSEIFEMVQEMKIKKQMI